MRGGSASRHPGRLSDRVARATARRRLGRQPGSRSRRPGPSRSRGSRNHRAGRRSVASGRASRRRTAIDRIRSAKGPSWSATEVSLTTRSQIWPNSASPQSSPRCPSSSSKWTSIPSMTMSRTPSPTHTPFRPSGCKGGDVPHRRDYSGKRTEMSSTSSVARSCRGRGMLVLVPPGAVIRSSGRLVTRWGPAWSATIRILAPRVADQAVFPCDGSSVEAFLFKRLIASRVLDVGDPGRGAK